MRAISYDRRGFGRSDQPWSGYEIQHVRANLAAVMDYWQGGGRHAGLVSHGRRRSRALPIAATESRVARQFS